jgi:hypothetical protein
MANSIARSPAFRSQNIDGVMVAWKQTANSYFLSKYLPFKTYDKDVLELDIDVPQYGGATPLSARGAEAPILRVGNGRSHEAMEVPVWKEKITVSTDELYDRRVLGTFNQLEKAVDLMSRRREVVLERLANRMEVMRKQLLFDRQITGTTKDGQTLTWEYNRQPADFRPTATAPWDDPALANPVKDLKEWLRIWKDSSHYEPIEMIVPRYTLEKLCDIDFFRDMEINRNFENTPDNVAQYLSRWFGGVRMRESFDRLAVATVLTATSAASDTTLNLQDVYDLAANDVLTLINIETLEEERLTVVSVSGKVVTVAAPGVARAGGYVAGDMVAYYKYTIPADKALIIGAKPGANGPLKSTNLQASPDARYIADWGEIASTRATDTTIEGSPKPGIFRKVLDKTDEEIPHIDEIIGAHALGRIFDGKGWMVCTIF